MLNTLGVKFGCFSIKAKTDKKFQHNLVAFLTFLCKLFAFFCQKDGTIRLAFDISFFFKSDNHFVRRGVGYA